MKLYQGSGGPYRRGTAALVCGAVLMTACAPGRGAAVSATPSRDLPARERIEVWSARTSQVLHAVRFTSDSVSGVSPLKRPECDSCRVSFPLTAVDSMRSVSGEGNAIAGVLAPVVVLFAVIAAWRLSDSD